MVLTARGCTRRRVVTPLAGRGAGGGSGGSRGGGIAARLLLTAEMISADQACRWNLYHELVAEDVVWPRAHEIAQMCAESAPTSLQLTKKVLNETIAETLETMLSAGAAVSATSRTTEAASEGLAAFHEKRDPNWP